MAAYCGLHLHSYRSGRAQFDIGRAYSGEDYKFSLPEKKSACDFRAFSIWCRTFTALFTLITWNDTIYVSVISLLHVLM